MSKQVDFKISGMDALLESIGAGQALGDAVKENRTYVAHIMRVAFNTSENEFNLKIAADASAGLNAQLKHMFEFGTLGVNRHKSSIRPRPTDERARLWKMRLQGGGMKWTAIVDFKQAIAYTPRPTVAQTGMSSSVIALMQNEKHVFKNRAKVFESGGDMNIKHRDARFILIPKRRGMDTSKWRSNDIKRGYILIPRPYSWTVSAPDAAIGSFQTYLERFWKNTAPVIYDSSLSKQIVADFAPLFLTQKRGGFKPIVTINTRTAVAAQKKKVIELATQRAYERAISGKSVL